MQTEVISNPQDNAPAVASILRLFMKDQGIEVSASLSGHNPDFDDA